MVVETKNRSKISKIKDILNVKRSLRIHQDVIQFTASYDPLTKLPNRDLFREKLEDAIIDSVNEGKSISILYLDLDNFKDINDSYGHDFGDKILKKIAGILKKLARTNDLLARLGGDEFAIISYDSTEKSATILAESIIAEFKNPIIVNYMYFNITTSIGIVICPNDSKDANNILKYCDQALYKVKATGGNGYQFFHPEINYHINRKREIKSSIENALEIGEFKLWYQPQYNTQTGELIGAEALIRWFKTDGKMVSPVEFIPIAEQYGLIENITNKVVELAVEQVREWMSKNLKILPVSINIPGNLFKFKYIHDIIENKIIASGIDPRLIEIEITETTMISDFSESKEIFDHCDNLGISVIIDDFGTGYSSLSYLKKLLTKKIKIDKIFIDHIAENEIDYTICKAIIEMSHSLKRKVVAEGVETKEQADILKRLGCDIIQGYYYSKPLNAEQYSLKLVV